MTYRFNAQQVPASVCRICGYQYRPAPSKRTNPCPNCAAIEKTGESLVQRAQRKTSESMKRSRLKAQEKQKQKPRPEYKVPRQSKKGAIQARQVSETKKGIRSELVQTGFGQCDGCGGFFRTLDASHKIPLSQSIALASERDNIRLLCRDCHNKWESLDPLQMLDINCLVPDLKYLFNNDPERFWKIHFRFLDEYTARPTPKLERVLGKIEKFEE